MTARVALIGSGYFSQFHVDAWARLSVEVVGICSLDAESAARHAAQFGGPPVFSDAAEMLRQLRPDVVDIVTPPATHLDLIERALDVGALTICQKPFCGGLAGAQKAAALAKAAGGTLVVHENFRFQPWYREIARHLGSGAVGQVFGATFRLRPGDGQGPDAYLARQPYFQQMPRFLVHETLVHLIDVMRFLFGEVQGVYADLRRLNPVIAGEDAGLIVLDFEAGVQGVIDGNRLVDHAAENRRLVMGEMTIDGAGAVLHLTGDGRLFRRPHGENTAAEIAYDWQNSGFGGDCVHALCKHVLDCRAAGRAPENTADAYLANLHLVEAVYRSAAEGRRVAL